MATRSAEPNAHLRAAGRFAGGKEAALATGGRKLGQAQAREADLGELQQCIVIILTLTRRVGHQARVRLERAFARGDLGGQDLFRGLEVARAAQTIIAELGSLLHGVLHAATLPVLDGVRGLDVQEGVDVARAEEGLRFGAEHRLKRPLRRAGVGERTSDDLRVVRAGVGETAPDELLLELLGEALEPREALEERGPVARVVVLVQSLVTARVASAAAAMFFLRVRVVVDLFADVEVRGHAQVGAEERDRLGPTVGGAPQRLGGQGAWEESKHPHGDPKDQGFRRARSSVFHLSPPRPRLGR